MKLSEDPVIHRRQEPTGSAVWSGICFTRQNMFRGLRDGELSLRKTSNNIHRRSFKGTERGTWQPISTLRSQCNHVPDDSSKEVVTRRSRSRDYLDTRRLRECVTVCSLFAYLPVSTLMLPLLTAFPDTRSQLHSLVFRCLLWLSRRPSGLQHEVEIPAVSSLRE